MVYGSAPLILVVRPGKNMITDEEYKIRQETLLKTGAAAFESAGKYTTLILGAGYAGGFILISASKDKINNVLFLSALLLLSLSLGFFVVWEIIKMISNSNSINRLTKLVDTPMVDFERKYDEQLEYEAMVKIRLSRYWMFILCSTIIPGSVACGLLAVGAIQALWNQICVQA